MNARLPQRPRQHQLETESIRYIEGQIPGAWTLQPTREDYGVDASIEIFEEDGPATALEFLVQVKGSETSTPGDYEILQLRTGTYEYLKLKLQVVILIKYVHEARKAYWWPLRNMPQPRANTSSVRVRIPKTNQLNAEAIFEIRQLVEAVSRRKLEANGP